MEYQVGKSLVGDVNGYGYRVQMLGNNAEHYCCMPFPGTNAGYPGDHGFIFLVTKVVT